LVVQVTSTTPSAITALVSALTVLEEGSYTIGADFVAEDCGDGIIAGREVCDDSNETANDGCSADCRTIEYSYFCSQAPLLSTTAAMSGTLVDASSIYAASCAADSGSEIHPSSLYRYTAAVAGTLHLKLTDGTSFATLSVRDGCSTPDSATELACRPAFLDGELDVVLAGGQSITAVVSSYFVDDGIGTFTLEATFTPN
jgi:cysteine-rich repeat protein